MSHNMRDLASTNQHDDDAKDSEYIETPSTEPDAVEESVLNDCSFNSSGSRNDGSFVSRLRTNITSIISKVFSPRTGHETGSTSVVTSQRLYPEASTDVARDDIGDGSAVQRKRRISPEPGVSTANTSRFYERVTKRRRLKDDGTSVDVVKSTGKRTHQTTPSALNNFNRIHQRNRQPYRYRLPTVSKRQLITSTVTRVPQNSESVVDSSYASLRNQLSDPYFAEDRKLTKNPKKNLFQSFLNAGTCEQDGTVIGNSNSDNDQPAAHTVERAPFEVETVRAMNKNIAMWRSFSSKESVSDSSNSTFEHSRMLSSLDNSPHGNKRLSTFLGNWHYNQRKQSVSNSNLFFSSHLGGSKTLFSSKNSSSASSSRPPSTNNSAFGSTSSLNCTRSGKFALGKSPFYDGMTMYGGASAVTSKNGSDTYVRKVPYTMKPMEKSRQSVPASSSVSDRILEVLDDYEKMKKDGLVTSTYPIAADEQRRLMQMVNDRSATMLRSPASTKRRLVNLQVPTVPDMLWMMRMQKKANMSGSSSNQDTTKEVSDQAKVPSSTQTAASEPSSTKSYENEQPSCVDEPDHPNSVSRSARDNSTSSEYTFPSFIDGSNLGSDRNTGSTLGKQTTRKRRQHVEAVRDRSYQPLPYELPNVPLPLPLASTPLSRKSIKSYLNGTVAEERDVESEDNDNESEDDDVESEDGDDLNDYSECRFMFSLPDRFDVHSVHTEAVPEMTWISFAAPKVLSTADSVDVPLVQQHTPLFIWKKECALCSTSSLSNSNGCGECNKTNSISRTSSDTTVSPLSNNTSPPSKKMNSDSSQSTGQSSSESLISLENPCKTSSESMQSKRCSMQKEATPLASDSFESLILMQKTMTWSCGECLTMNNKKSERCVCCDHPKPSSSPKSSPASASLSTTGSSLQSLISMQKKTSWSCDTCLASNDMQSEKCICCEQPKPSSSPKVAPIAELVSKPATASSSFDSLISLQKATSWSCNMCMAMNDVKSERCLCCDHPKPSSSPKSSPSSASLSTTGSSLQSLISMQKKTSWSCDTCLASNDMQSEKCICCEQPKPSSSPKVAPVPELVSKPASTSSSFDSLISLQKATSWSCNMCMAMNEMQSEKCMCCEQPKPGAAPKMAPTTSSTPAATFTFGYNPSKSIFAKPASPDNNISTSSSLLTPLSGAVKTFGSQLGQQETVKAMEKPGLPTTDTVQMNRMVAEPIEDMKSSPFGANGIIDSPMEEGQDGSPARNVETYGLFQGVSTPTSAPATGETTNGPWAITALQPTESQFPVGGGQVPSAITMPFGRTQQVVSDGNGKTSEGMFAQSSFRSVNPMQHVPFTFGSSQVPSTTGLPFGSFGGPVAPSSATVNVPAQSTAPTFGQTQPFGGTNANQNMFMFGTANGQRNSSEFGNPFGNNNTTVNKPFSFTPMSPNFNFSSNSSNMAQPNEPVFQFGGQSQRNQYTPVGEFGTQGQTQQLPRRVKLRGIRRLHQR